MSTQRLRQAPELIHEPQLQSEPGAQELLVEYPGSAKIVVNLPEESLWELLASSARAPFNADEARPANLVGTGGRAEQAPGSSAPLIVAATGLAVVAYLWSFIVL